MFEKSKNRFLRFTDGLGSSKNLCTTGIMGVSQFFLRNEATNAASEVQPGAFGNATPQNVCSKTSGTFVSRNEKANAASEVQPPVSGEATPQDVRSKTSGAHP